jgi:aspartate carbamoyltransferase catalytic subunit
MPPELIEELASKGVSQKELTKLDPVLGETDVLYITRVQKERFDDMNEYEKVKGAYVITAETLKQAKEQMVVMHPLPRVGEISLDVDADPRAAYFRQMEYGLYVRMALLAMVLGKA